MKFGAGRGRRRSGVRSHSVRAGRTSVRGRERERETCARRCAPRERQRRSDSRDWLGRAVSVPSMRTPLSRLSLAAAVAGVGRIWCRWFTSSASSGNFDPALRFASVSFAVEEAARSRTRTFSEKSASEWRRVSFRFSSRAATPEYTRD